MTIANARLLETLTGSLSKAQDMEDKLCEVMLETEVSPDDYKLIQAAISTLGRARQIVSALFPPTVD